MRLKPPVTQDEALRWLRDQAALSGMAVGPPEEPVLGRMAAAMVAISAADVQLDVEPLTLSLPVPVRD